MDMASVACRGKSQYLNGNVNHSFQLNSTNTRKSADNHEYQTREYINNALLCISSFYVSYVHRSANDRDDVFTGKQIGCPSEQM
jgi:hypothetical protein